MRSLIFSVGWYLLVAGLIFSCSACFVGNRLAYLQGLKDSTYAPAYYKTPVLIQAGDLLSISISSSDPNSASIFNGVNATAQATGGQVANPGLQVNPSGTIELPKIGAIAAIGKTTESLGRDIKTALQPYFKDLVVNVRLINFRVTLVGEVGNPASLTIPSERINVFEAIGMAGDLTTAASRKDVLVVRDSAGNMQTGHIDLTSPGVIHSPYFFLKPGDMVYVHPTKSKGLFTGGAITFWPILLSALSAGILLVNTLSK